MIWLGMMMGCFERPPMFIPNGDVPVAGCLVVQPSGPVRRETFWDSTLYSPRRDARLNWNEAVPYGEVSPIDEVIFDTKTLWYATKGEDKRPFAPAIGDSVSEPVVVVFDADGVVVGLGTQSTLPPCPIGQGLEPRKR